MVIRGAPLVLLLGEQIELASGAPGPQGWLRQARIGQEHAMTAARTRALGWRTRSASNATGGRTLSARSEVRRESSSLRPVTDRPLCGVKKRHTALPTLGHLPYSVQYMSETRLRR